MRLILVCLLCSCFTLNAQNLNYGGVFPTIDHSGDLTEKIGYGLYCFGAFPILNLDRPDISKDPWFLLLYSEQYLSFAVNKHLSFTGSYVYQRANPVYEDYVNENRFYAQARYKHTFKKTNLAHRLRFDGRFIENRLTNKTPFTHRIRYLLGVDFPIPSPKNTLYFTAYEELFFNTTGNANPRYEENWAYAALGIKLNANNKIEPGILYITWSTGKPYWFHQYYFQLTWINHLNFKKTHA